MALVWLGIGRVTLCNLYLVLLNYLAADMSWDERNAPIYTTG